MGLFSAEKIFGIKLRESANDGSDFGTPDADYRFTFLGEDGYWHTKDASGVVRYMPGVEVDRVTGTSNVNVTGTSSAAATTVLTGNAVTYNGSTTVDVHYFCPSAITPAASPGWITICLFESTTNLGNIAVVFTTLNTASGRFPIAGKFRLTPTAASHTYLIKAYRDGGASTATLSGGAGGSDTLVPMEMRIVVV